jgi:hypothetical protein
MAISNVTIANMALSHIGGGTIAAMDEASTAARQCNLWYTTALKHTLSLYHWSFARKRATLALHGDDPSDEWSFRYIVPSDMVAARELLNTGVISVFTLDDPTRQDRTDAIPFILEISDDGTPSLQTNMEDAVLIYTSYQTQAELFPATFITALSHVLASYIAFALTGNLDIKDAQIKWAYSYTRAAAAQDSNQNVPEKPREAEAIRARY